MNNPYYDLSRQMNNVSLGNNHNNQSYQYSSVPSLYSSAPQDPNAPKVSFVDSRGQAPYSQNTTYTAPYQSTSIQFCKVPVVGQFTSAPSSYQNPPSFSGTQQNPMYFQNNSRNIPNQQNIYQQKTPTPDVQRQVLGRQDLSTPNSAVPQQPGPQAIQDPRTVQLSRQSSQNYQQNGSVEGTPEALPYVQTQKGLREQQFVYNQQGQMQQRPHEQQNQQQQVFNEQQQQGTNLSHLQQNQPGSIYLQNRTGQNLPPQNAQQSNVPQPITSQQYDPQTISYQGMQPQGTLQQSVPQQRLQNQDFRQQNQGQNNAPNSWEKFEETARRGAADRNSTDLFQQYFQQRQSNQSFVNDTERMQRNQSEQLHQSDQKPPTQMSLIRYPPSSIYSSTNASQFAQQPLHLQQLPPLSASPQTQFERYPSKPNEGFRNLPQNAQHTTAQIPDPRNIQMPPPSSQHNVAPYPSQAYTQQYPNDQKMNPPNQNISQQAAYATQTDPSFSISRQTQANSQSIQTSQYGTNYPRMEQNIAQNVSQNGPYQSRNPVASAPLGGQNIQDRSQFNFTFGTGTSISQTYRFGRKSEMPSSFNSQTNGRTMPTSSTTLQRQGSQNQPIQSQANTPYSNFPQPESQIYAKQMDESIHDGRLPSLYNPSSVQNGVTQQQPYQTAHPGLAYANQNQVPIQNPAGVYDKNVPPYQNMSSSHQMFQNQTTPVSVQSQMRDPSQQMNQSQLRNPEEKTSHFQDPRNQYQRQNNPQNIVQDRQYPVGNPSNPDQRNANQAYNGPNPTNQSFNPTPQYQYPGQDTIDNSIRPSNPSYPRSNTAPQIQDQRGLVNQFQRLNSNEAAIPNQNQNMIQNPSQLQYNTHMNIRNPSINPSPRFMNPSNPPGNPGVYPPTEVNYRAGPYDTATQQNISHQAAMPSQPIVIMPGYSSSVTNTRPAQENFEPRIESIFEHISDKQGPMFEKLRKVLVEIFNIQDDVLNFKGRRGDQGYINIEEMLTRQLLALDSVHADGNEEIRLARRSIVRQVQGLISTLERRAKT